MPSIYFCQFLGDGWSRWQGGYQLPPLPKGFDEDSCTVTMSSRAGREWCYVYEPESEQISSCFWDGEEWSDWDVPTLLPTAPNFVVDDGIEDQQAFFSISSHDDGEWMVSYNPLDGTVFWSLQTAGGFAPWEGPFQIEDPPNLDDMTDVFCAGDGSKQWLISVNLEQWSVSFSIWEDGEFGPWLDAPDLPIPDEWLDLGLDLDGVGRQGQYWIYATVYDDEFHD